MIRTLIGASLACFLAGAAVAQEAAPLAPIQCPAAAAPVIERPVKPTRPPLPSCVNEARGTHTCRANILRDYEAAMTRYEGEFDAYVATVNAYLGRLEAYTREAVAYAECERRIVMPSAIITG